MLHSACDSVCNSCYGGKLVFLGVLLLIQHYWLGWPWAVFFGIVAILWGFMKMAVPSCHHSKDKSEKGKKKK